jgi:PEP-CTERM motif
MTRTGTNRAAIALSTMAVFCGVNLAANPVRASTATTKGDLTYAGGAAVVTTGAGLATGPFFPLTILVGAVVELGGAVVKGVCDPPGPSSCPLPAADTTNASVMADEPLLVPTLPSETGAPAAFAQAANNFITEMSELVQSFKDIEDTMARLEGAEDLGNATDIADQTMWLTEFENLNIAQSDAANTYLREFLGQLQADYPSEYNLVPSLSDVLATLNGEQTGTFPAPEESLITSWDLTPDEVEFAEISFRSTTDAQIVSLGPLSFGQAALGLTVPEPSTWVMMLLGFAGLGYAAFRRAAMA